MGVSAITSDFVAASLSGEKPPPPDVLVRTLVEVFAANGGKPVLVAGNTRAIMDGAQGFGASADVLVRTRRHRRTDGDKSRPND